MFVLWAEGVGRMRLGLGLGLGLFLGIGRDTELAKGAGNFWVFGTWCQFSGFSGSGFFVVAVFLGAEFRFFRDLGAVVGF